MRTGDRNYTDRQAADSGYIHIIAPWIAGLALGAIPISGEKTPLAVCRLRSWPIKSMEVWVEVQTDHIVCCWLRQLSDTTTRYFSITAHILPQSLIWYSVDVLCLGWPYSHDDGCLSQLGTRHGLADHVHLILLWGCQSKGTKLAYTRICILIFGHAIHMPRRRCEHHQADPRRTWLVVVVVDDWLPFYIVFSAKYFVYFWRNRLCVQPTACPELQTGISGVVLCLSTVSMCVRNFLLSFMNFRPFILSTRVNLECGGSPRSMLVITNQNSTVYLHCRRRCVC